MFKSLYKLGVPVHENNAKIILWCQRIALTDPSDFSAYVGSGTSSRFVSHIQEWVRYRDVNTDFSNPTRIIGIHLSTQWQKLDWFAVSLVILFAVALRMAMALILSTDLTSDVLDTHLYALDILSGNIPVTLGKYTYIPASSYKSMMGVTLAGFYAILGASVRTAKFFMVIFAGLTCGMIYKVGKDISGDHRVGLVAALLFATYPSLICYTSIPTSEHLDIWLLTFTSLLWLVFLRNSRNDQWYWVLLTYALLGAMIGLVDWYRPIGPLVLLACILAEIFTREQSPKIPQIFARIAIFSICYFLVSDISHTIDERMNLIKLPSYRQRLG